MNRPAGLVRIHDEYEAAPETRAGTTSSWAGQAGQDEPALEIGEL